MKREDLLKLPTDVLVTDLLYYKDDHKAMLYISSELEERGFVIDAPLHEWVVRTIKNQERKRKGTVKLLSLLNKGKTVSVGEGTVGWLKGCGFSLEVVDVPYQGNLPVEDRIPSVFVKLK